MTTAADSIVRARVSSDVKEKASAILKSMGITTSDAIRMMLVQVVAEKALPFEVKSPNAATQEAIAASRAGDVATFATVEDLFADLNDDDD